MINCKDSLSYVNYVNIAVALADENSRLYVFVCQLVVVVEYRPSRWGGLVSDIFLRLIVLHHVIITGCSSSSPTRHYCRCVEPRIWW